MTDVDFDALWNYQRPGETETAFRALLEATVADPDQHAQLLTQIARAQGLQGRFADADATLDEVAPHLSDDQVILTTRYLLERGRVLNSSGNPDAARPLFHQAWDISRTDPDAAFFAVDAAHMLAIAASSFDETIAWNVTALEYAEASSNERARTWCGSLYNNLGWTYHDHGDYEPALRYFRLALEWEQAHGTDLSVRIATLPVGRVLRLSGRAAEALPIQQVLMDDWNRSGAQQAGYVSEELAECLYAVGQIDESRPHFAEAHLRLSQDSWLVEHEPDRIDRLQRLSQPD